jgi:bacillithiol biosynthesis cysteine-adding enzyme BshC
LDSHKISYKDTGLFSQLIIDYLDQKKDLDQYISYFPNEENFLKQIKSKSDNDIDRELLQNIVKEQNSFLELSEICNANIEALKSKNTFSVTTGHQLCLFTGPLYFIYKIASTINLVNRLKNNYPKYNFVPVFWLASEDHDFEEINSINLFNKPVKWDSSQNGAVGRMKLDGISLTIAEIQKILGSSNNAKKLIDIFLKSYNEDNNLSQATRILINELFGKYGLLIIDGDDILLKQKISEIIDHDINNSRFYNIIKKSNEKISVKYHSQAYVRPINFFRLSEKDRVRVTEKVDFETINKNPEIFSPNVLMRPIYQEMILPNIAYVGGGSELSYWFQLYDTFKDLSLPMPILVMRNSVVLLDSKKQNKIKKLSLDTLDFFEDINLINKKYILKNSDKINLNEELMRMKEVFQSINQKIEDPSLISSLNAIEKKNNNMIADFENKVIKNLKSKNEIQINQILKIKNDFFPNKKLQERHDSFIPQYVKYGDNFIKNIIFHLNPLDTNFVILNLEN